jgi:GDPmannose 4,6-dehydratase
MASKVALVTGVTGQDGAYLAELLLGKGYESTASSGALRPSTPDGSTSSTATCTSRMSASSSIMAISPTAPA